MGWLARRTRCTRSGCSGCSGCVAAPARKAKGSASSPCTSMKRSTPVSSILASVWYTWWCVGPRPRAEGWVGGPGSGVWVWGLRFRFGLGLGSGLRRAFRLGLGWILPIVRTSGDRASVGAAYEPVGPGCSSAAQLSWGEAALEALWRRLARAPEAVAACSPSVLP